ncbi:MAG: response regulator [Gammaproteobacteria bacterium]|nr:response regulator [Gammaproteobacteria bacterium]
MHNILVCSDDSANLRSLCDILTNAGYSVYPCETGEDAFNALSQYEFNLGVIDLHPGAQSGEMLAAKYHDTMADKRTPLILFANTIQAVKDTAAVEVAAYIDHPVDSETLLRVVAENIVGRRTGTGCSDTELRKTSQQPVFDPVALSNFPKEALDQDFLSSLFEIFLDNAAVKLAKLHESIAQNDLTAFHDHIHALKGIAGNVKAKRLEAMAHTCQFIESSRFAQSQEMESVLNAMQACLAETRIAMEAYLQQEFGAKS